MRRGFFDDNIASTAPISNVARCGSCGLYRTCNSPRMKIKGKGRLKILFVGEAPGREEDETGVPFVGNAGRRLRYESKREGIHIDTDCWRTNALCCRPPKNRDPGDKEIAACRPNVFSVINTLHPKLVILLGRFAIQSVIGHYWQRPNDKYEVQTWYNRTIPLQKPNMWININYHPMFIEYDRGPLAGVLFRRAMTRMAKLTGLRDGRLRRPWKEVPDYASQVDLIYKPRQAILKIQNIKSRSRLSFDFETNTLKPEVPGSEIVACSICRSGVETFAFPWTAEVGQAMKRIFLDKKIQKIASNMKFEHRWIYAKLGITTRGWWWDTMLGAHILNQERQITGLKYQSFVLLGLAPYDRHITPLLEDLDPETKLNKIHTVPLRQLLEYNGLDSLTAYKVAKLQIAELSTFSRGPRDEFKIETPGV